MKRDPEDIKSLWPIAKDGTRIKILGSHNSFHTCHSLEIPDQGL